LNYQATKSFPVSVKNLIKPRRENGKWRGAEKAHGKYEKGKSKE